MELNDYLKMIDAFKRIKKIIRIKWNLWLRRTSIIIIDGRFKLNNFKRKSLKIF